MKVILSGYSMKEHFGAHTCVAYTNSRSPSSVNTVSIYITQKDERTAEDAVIAATFAIRDMLKGK